MNENEVLDMIEHYFSQHQPRDYHSNVMRHGVRRDGNWWYVSVQSSDPEVRARDYAMVMEQAEEDLERANLKVLLLPVLPGD